MRTASLHVLRFILLLALCPALWAQEPGPDRPALQSPRLAALLAAVEREGDQAVESFWNEVARSHSPLVEDLPDHPDEALFTFLWRASPEEDVVNTRLGASFRTRGDNDGFTRLGKTTVWYTSYRMPRSARLIYRLRVPQGLQKSPLAQDRFSIGGIRYEMFPDPLNPRTFPHASPPPQAQSVALGPAAADSPYLQRNTGIPAGTLTRAEIQSARLQGNRSYTVYTPAGFSARSQRLPLLLVFDAEAYIEQVETPLILDNLIAAGKIPPLVAVFVHSAGTRDTDLPPNDRFPAFIADELLPRLRREYRLAKDPQKNVACGSSLGGLAAAHLALRYPQLFGRVISQSGSYWWWPDYQTEPSPSPNAGWFVKRVAESPAQPLQFYLEAGQWEPAGMLYANRMLNAVLRGKGVAVSYREFVGGHHYAYWQQTLPEALIAMFGRGVVIDPPSS